VDLAETEDVEVSGEVDRDISEDTQPVNQPDAVSPDAVDSGDVSVEPDVAADEPDTVAPDSADGQQNDADARIEDDVVVPIPLHETQPVLYPANRVHSPLTGFVVDTMREIAASNSDLQNDVFMKVGASGTVSSSFLDCFASDDVLLDGRDDLQVTIDHFLGGNANDGGSSGPTTPFDRDTYAAEVGRTAKWAIGGSPSPGEQEITAIQPRFAIINYGTNDMQMGNTHGTALWTENFFYDSFTSLVDQVSDEGIIPILTGLNPRTDIPSADLWVPTYNAVVRGVAQSRQIPFIDLHLAVEPLPSHGLSSDGLHGNSYYSNGKKACYFTDEALQYGYNTRNLLTLESLDRIRQVAVGESDALDVDGLFLAGDGSAQDPFEIPTLPFTHVADTTLSENRNLSLYSGCGSESNESGPEFLYSLTLDRETALRAIVLDHAGADIDLHILDETGTEGGCISRAHHMVEGRLPAGDYLISIDTWVSASSLELTGEYLFVLIECDESDQDCSEILQ